MISSKGLKNTGPISHSDRSGG